MRLASLTSTSKLALPADSYIYKIVKVGHHNLAAISSDNSLRLIDPTTLLEVPGGIFKNVHDGVTCLQVIDHDPNSILTAGRDAVVRQYDWRSGQKTLQLGHGQSAKAMIVAVTGIDIDKHLVI